MKKDPFKKRREKVKANRGRFERVEVGGEALPIMNFYIYTSRNDSKRHIELASNEELTALHFTEVEMNVVLPVKRLVIKARFEDAFQKGKFKIYKFLVLDEKEYYI